MAPRTKKVTKAAEPATPEPKPSVVVKAAVAGVIIDTRGRILFGVRNGDRGGGELAMPGGSIEFGESIEAAVEREVLEETGLVVKALPFSRVQPELFIVNHIGASEQFIVVFVEARIISGELANREPTHCRGWEWLTFTQLASRVQPDAIAAWQNGQYHEALCWTPLPQLSHYREHLGFQ
jgi:8-oxo-dGTP diphosphatase